MSLITSRRRLLAAGAGLVAVAPFAAGATDVYEISVSRDQGCGCCLNWVAHLRRSGRFNATVTDVADMSAVKRRLGVPEDLWSCHTAVVAGYAIEGHTPADDIVRLIETRPAGLIGVAVPGMPRGSPGMDVPGGGRDAFDVIGFRADGRRNVFASYARR